MPAVCGWQQPAKAGSLPGSSAQFKKIRGGDFGPGTPIFSRFSTFYLRFPKKRSFQGFIYDNPLTPNSKPHTPNYIPIPLFLRLKFFSLATKYTKETYLYWYELMQLIRQFELMAEEKYKMEGKIRGFFHAYVGQEALAAGCMTATKPEDSFITAYRDHGLAIAKGVSVNSCMAELYGKATGCAKGKGGSMHFFGKDVNFYGGHGIVGAQIGTGAGLAFAEKYKGTDAVCLTFFGDGAARQGMLHEIFNMAMTWRLPVIFICENNNYAMGTSVQRTSNIIDIYKLADAYEMPADVIDGMSTEAVHEGVSRAVKRAREGDGPTLLEIKTYRYKGHSISDPQKYRTKEEVEEYKQKDPIQALLTTIYDNKLATEDEIRTINERVDAAVAESVKFAEESPWPDDSEVYKDIYVDQNYPFITD
jgi:pyruvate dehydrogenase E1 component alpha subunit